MKAAGLLPTLCLALSPCTALAQGTCGDPIDPETLGEASGLTPEQLAAVNKGVGLFVGNTEKCNAILSGITDKESADAAAPQLQALMDALEPCWEELQRDVPPELLESVVQMLLMQHADKVQATDRLIQGLAETEPPFYGSEVLSAVLTEEADAEETGRETLVTPDQIAAAEVMMEHFLETAGKTLELLLTIEDTATADAAAPKLKDLLEELATSWDSIQMWAESEGVAEELDDLLMERYRERLEDVEEMDKNIMRLADHEPPYYGSAALKRALEGPEPAEAEDIDDTQE